MLRIERFRAEPGLELKGHAHSTWHVCLVTDGAFVERTSGGEVVCESGAARISRPGASHALEFGSDGGECVIIEAEGGFWSRVLARAVEGGGDSRFGFAGCPFPNSAERVADWLGGMISDLDGARAETPAWLDEAARALGSDDAPTISRLARDCGLTRAQFARLFRARFGYRPVEYRTLARVRSAAALARHAPIGLAEVALASGFSHQSHMTNAFQEILGATPAALRRQAS